jgi:hypothetical protein
MRNGYFDYSKRQVVEGSRHFVCGPATVATHNVLALALNLGVVGPYRLVADPQPKCRLLYKLILRYTLSKLLVLLYTSDAAGIQRR